MIRARVTVAFRGGRAVGDYEAGAGTRGAEIHGSSRAATGVQSGSPYCRFGVQGEGATASLHQALVEGMFRFRRRRE